MSGSARSGPAPATGGGGELPLFVHRPGRVQRGVWINLQNVIYVPQSCMPMKSCPASIFKKRFYYENWTWTKIPLSSSTQIINTC